MAESMFDALLKRPRRMGAGDGELSLLQKIAPIITGEPEDYAKPDFWKGAGKALAFDVLGAPGDIGYLLGNAKGIQESVADNWGEGRPLFENVGESMGDPRDYGLTSDALAERAGMPFTDEQTRGRIWGDLVVAPAAMIRALQGLRRMGGNLTAAPAREPALGEVFRDQRGAVGPVDPLDGEALPLDRLEVDYEAQPSVDEFIGDLLKDTANEDSQLRAPASSPSIGSSATPEGGKILDTGGMAGRADDVRQATPEVLPSTRLKGLPESANIAGRTVPIESHIPTQELAKKYMLEAGMDYKPMTTYRKVDPSRALSIADEYGRMQHNPTDPAVMSAYQDLADETRAQYQAIKDSGLEIEFITGDVNPYEGSPRMLMDDIKNNNHLYVYSTRDGYGESGITAEDMMNNPLLAETDVVISGQKALVNDLFRAVHDVNGHNMHGVGFRADGEENAWRSHSMMYKPNARRAMTNETRGQNSWVNYGPDGDANLTAKDVDTIYAPQKIGLMPEWVTTEGVSDLSPSVSDSEMVAALSRSKPNKLPRGRGQALKGEKIRSRLADSSLANWRAMSPGQQAAHAASMPKIKGKPPTVDRMKFKYEDDAKQARKNVQSIENLKTVRPTVDNPLRAAYPGIYKKPVKYSQPKQIGWSRRKIQR